MLCLKTENSKKFKIYCNCEVKKINYEEGVATGVEGKFLGNLGTKGLLTCSSIKISNPRIVLPDF